MSKSWHKKKLLYFAWIRERIGIEEETVAIPQTVETVRDLLDWLKTRGEEFAAAFEFPDIIRVALDQNHVEHDEKIEGAREIALFPPMTGG